MSTEENKALVHRLLEHVLSDASRTNPKVLHQYFADNFVDHVRIHHETSGVHGIKDAMTEVHQAATDFRMKVTHLVAEGEWVAAHWQATATRQRPLKKHRQLKDVAPRGGEQTASGMTLFRLADGKIVESWNYDNALEIHQNKT